LIWQEDQIIYHDVGSGDTGSVLGDSPANEFSFWDGEINSKAGTVLLDNMGGALVKNLDV